MSLVGRYYCPENGSTFTVTEANVANGQGAGIFEIDNISIPVKIHYHFENNVGPITDLWFAGGKDDPNEYVGGAGRTNNQGFNSIKLAGGYPTHTDTRTFQGEYLRQ